MDQPLVSWGGQASCGARATMALPRWKLTPQTLLGSWGWKGREVVGHRLGHVPPWDRDGMRRDQVGGHTANPQGRPVLSIPGSLRPETTKETGSAVTPSRDLLIRLSGSPPSRLLLSPVSYLLVPGQPHQGCCIPWHHRHLSKWCPGTGQPTPVAVVPTPSQRSALGCGALTVTV